MGQNKSKGKGVQEKPALLCSGVGVDRYKTRKGFRLQVFPSMTFTLEMWFHKTAAVAAKHYTYQGICPSTLMDVIRTLHPRQFLRDQFTSFLMGRKYNDSIASVPTDLLPEITTFLDVEPCTTSIPLQPHILNIKRYGSVPTEVTFESNKSLGGEGSEGEVKYRFTEASPDSLYNGEWLKENLDMTCSIHHLCPPGSFVELKEYDGVWRPHIVMKIDDHRYVLVSEERYNEGRAAFDSKSEEERAEILKLWREARKGKQQAGEIEKGPEEDEEDIPSDVVAERERKQRAKDEVDVMTIVCSNLPTNTIGNLHAVRMLRPPVFWRKEHQKDRLVDPLVELPAPLTPNGPRPLEFDNRGTSNHGCRHTRLMVITFAKLPKWGDDKTLTSLNFGANVYFSFPIYTDCDLAAPDQVLDVTP